SAAARLPARGDGRPGAHRRSGGPPAAPPVRGRADRQAAGLDPTDEGRSGLSLPAACDGGGRRGPPAGRGPRGPHSAGHAPVRLHRRDRPALHPLPRAHLVPRDRGARTGRSRPVTAAPLSARDLAALLGVDPPTDEQVRIIESPHDRAAAVIAGAGSGKTAVISLRVVWLVANGLVDADRILGLTFTRKAVGELNSRVRDYLARYRSTPQGRAGTSAEQTLPGLDLPTVSTYNSYAAALVGDHGIGIGLEGSEDVLDAAACDALMQSVLDSAATDEVLSSSRSTMAAWVTGLLSEMGDHLVSFEQIDAHLEECLDALCTGEYLRGLAKSVSGKRSGVYADKAAKTLIVDQLRTLADAHDA